jgi:flagellar motor switch protein FliG
MKVTVDDLLGWKPKDIARLFEAFSVEETATAMHGMSNELQQHILASIRLQRRWRIMVSPVHRTSMPLKDVEAIHRRIEAVAGNILEGKAGGAKP